MSEKKNSFFVGMKYKNENIFTDIKLKEKIKDYDYGGSNISYHIILKKYYLNLSYTSKSEETKSNKICAIDPGVKNFITVYSDSKISKIGINCKETINKICKETDIIKSIIDKKEYKLNDVTIKINANRRRNLRNALHRKLEKLKNIRDVKNHNKINDFIMIFKAINNYENHL